MAVKRGRMIGLDSATHDWNTLPLPEALIASNSYGRYCIPASSRHRPAARAVLSGRVWEPQTIAFLASKCGNADVVHAGTYFGDFLPALSKAAAPGAWIWAFEPFSENFMCAETTLKLNDIRNVKLTHAALGERAGTASLHIGPANRRAGGASAIKDTCEPRGSHEEVRVITIDGSVPESRHVSIIQLDVEHYEQQALAGALATIRRCLPLLVLENVPADGDWFREHVLSLGYRQTGQVDRNFAFEVRRSQT